jgi:hypothetical protein
LNQNSAETSRLSFLGTSGFWEKIALLLATAIVSGIVVPLIIKQTDESHSRRAAVSQAQEQLFRDVSETMLTFETLALDVSWFGSIGTKDSVNQQRAYVRYNERTVDLVARWRAQAARARTLTSPEVSKKLDAMLADVFRTQDSPMVSLWTSCGTKCDWTSQHRINEKMLGVANQFIEDLARDLGLVKY